MKRLLLANFAECPENLHFERAFVRAAAARRFKLDIVHDFDSHYAFLGALPPPGGKRMKYAGLDSLAGCAGAYDLLVLLGGGTPSYQVAEAAHKDANPGFER